MFVIYFIGSLVVLYVALRILIYVMEVNAPLHDDWDEDDAVASEFARRK